MINTKFENLAVSGSKRGRQWDQEGAPGTWRSAGNVLVLI